ncbi:MAG: zinc-dependent alcohol dehydrogenase family protein [Pseudoruegeria sp.]
MAISARYDSFGAPSEVLYLSEIDDVSLTAGQIRLSVLRSPVNPSDLIQVSGNYGIKPELPAVPGNEGLGRVTEVSEGVANVAPGNLVLLPAGVGAWQSNLVVKSSGLFPLPEADLDQLSMLTINPPTALLLLEEFVDLKPGDWMIQSAANSAVGGYVIQLAHQKGIRTINVVRRAELIAPLKAMGADVVLVDGPDLVADVAAAIGDGSVRLGIDAVAGETFARLVDCLAMGGVMVNYGAMSGVPSVFTPQAAIFRDITAKGFWLAQWFRQADAARKQEVYGTLISMVAQGQLSAKVDAVYPLVQLDQAISHASKSGRDGKVLIAPNEHG